MELTTRHGDPAAEHAQLLAEARALFVSPHPDDAVFSCGGTVARCAARGDRPVVLTVFNSAPPGPYPATEAVRGYHKSCGFGDDQAAALMQRRRDEDAAAVASLGATVVSLGCIEALYRGEGRYPTNRELFGAVQPADDPLWQWLALTVVELWKRTPAAEIYVPIGLWSHVDHQLCARLGDELRRAGATVWLYEEFPYVRMGGLLARRLKALPGATATLIDVSGWLGRRLDAMAAYPTQVSFLFAGGEFREPTRLYATSLAQAGATGAFERYWQGSSP